MESETHQQTSLRANRLNIERRCGRTIVDRVVREISLSVSTGQVVALTGEEGCGKSSLAQAMAGLLPCGDLKVRDGEIWLGDEQLVGMSRRKLGQIRQRRIAYFDRRMTEKLNPLCTIKDHFVETLACKTKSEREAGKNLIQALYEVGIAEPESVLACLPAELSPEALNRVMICMALQAGVDFIVADEMTADLDATVEQQILELLVDLKNRDELSMLIVAHHPGIIAALADEVVVMFDGVAIEEGKTEAVLSSPENSYTKALMACAPRLGERRFRLGKLSESDRQAAMKAVEHKLTAIDDRIL